MKPVLWEELTWEIVRDMRTDGVDIVLFPIGSTEQHGPHLPLNVDTLCAQTVAHAVSARTGVPVLPALPFGCALGHTRHWPGTLSLSPNTLALVIARNLKRCHRVWVHAHRDDERSRFQRCSATLRAGRSAARFSGCANRAKTFMRCLAACPQRLHQRR